MRVFVKLVIIAVLLNTYLFSTTAYASYKGIKISNNSGRTVYFKVNGQCTEDVIVVPANSIKLSPYIVGYLCGKTANCVFEAHEKSCDGMVAGTLTMTSDNQIEIRPGACHRVEGHVGYRTIKFDIFISPSPMCLK